MHRALAAGAACGSSSRSPEAAPRKTNDRDARAPAARQRRSLDQEALPIANGMPARPLEPGFRELFTPKLVTILQEGYGPVQLRADAVAGLTVAIVALPLSMAIAIAS